MADHLGRIQTETPKISEVLDGYLRTEHARLAARTYARDAEVISLLEQSLNADGVNDLIPEDYERFRRHGFDFEAGDPPNCGALGPYYLMVHLPTFLTAAQLRRHGGDEPELPYEAGTVIKKLAAWLKTHGHIDAFAAKVTKNLAADAGQRSPAMDELARRLDALAPDVADHEDDVLGDFEITHVEPEGIWVHDDMDDNVYGPIPLPDDVQDLCRVGWVISATLSRRDDAYQFFDVLNVFP